MSSLFPSPYFVVVVCILMFRCLPDDDSGLDVIVHREILLQSLVGVVRLYISLCVSRLANHPANRK